VKQDRVSVEDRFVTSSRSAIRSMAAVWRVVHLFQGMDGIAYARLVNSVDQSLTKTVATSALLDRSFFRQAQSEPAP
jgi:hypothetical protein